MNLIFSLVAVLVLGAIGFVGARSMGLHYLLGVLLPYLALVLFVGGFALRILKWAKAPVPFRIPTTCGQQKSLDWIEHDKYDNPATTGQVLVRMILEVLFFRSLFRNTTTEMHDGRPSYGATKWLWLGAIVFHYSFLVVLLRHLRFFTEPVPTPLLWIQALDGFFQVGVPVLYLTSLALLGGAGYLLLRRLYIPQLRYISLANDYFPLLLILGIALSGIILRHFVKTDIVGVKELTMGLVSFSPLATDKLQGLSPWFFSHLMLVCTLFAYFPFSKLMHAGGVFLSPTRNLANNSRAKRHFVKYPWDEEPQLHTYEEWEDDFREKMVACGLPVDKPLEKKDEKE